MSENKKIVTAVVITAVVTAVVWAPVGSFVQKAARYLPSKSAEKSFYNKLDIIDEYIEGRYLNEYDRENMYEQALEGYVNGLDEAYSKYYPPEEFKKYVANVEDSYVGIGVVVSADINGNIVVVAPFEDSSAYEAGVMPGDIIAEVDGVRYDDLNDAVNHIKNGAEGTEVEITFIRGDEIIEKTITRRRISSDSVKSEMIEDKIGYVRVSSFNKNEDGSDEDTYTEFCDEIESLQADGMEKLIIDLRDNPGGIFNIACQMADMLLPEGTVSYMEDKNGKRETYTSDAQMLDVPIVVLINENSASASEVFVGALKDYDRAEIVGTKSYGKGIVQTVFPFSDGSGISMTTAKYYSPNGICIHGIGIEPDYTVEMPEEYKNMYASSVAHDEDTQLQKAVELLR